MRIKAKQVINTPAAAVETRFNKVISQYDDYINYLLRNSRLLMIFGFIGIACLAASVFVYSLALKVQKADIVVVEVNELGRAQYFGSLNDKYNYRGFQVKDYMIEAVIRDFTQYTREIYVDDELMVKNLNRAVRWLPAELRQRLHDDVRLRDPFSKVGFQRLEVSIESILKTTERTWQVDWFDVTSTLFGTETERTRYRGLYTIHLQEPKTETERQENPLGIYIVDYSVVELKEAVR